jgi:hypothetical protein
MGPENPREYIDLIFSVVDQCGRRGIEVQIHLDCQGEIERFVIDDRRYVDLDEAFGKCREIIATVPERLP